MEDVESVYGVHIRTTISPVDVVIVQSNVSWTSCHQMSFLGCSSVRLVWLVWHICAPRFVRLHQLTAAQIMKHAFSWCGQEADHACTL